MVAEFVQGVLPMRAVVNVPFGYIFCSACNGFIDACPAFIVSIGKAAQLRRRVHCLDSIQIVVCVFSGRNRYFGNLQITGSCFYIRTVRFPLRI